MKTREQETLIKFNLEDKTAQIEDTTCRRTCVKHDEAVERVITVLENPDFKCNTDVCRSVDTCIYDMRTRCILTLQRDA